MLFGNIDLKTGLFYGIIHRNNYERRISVKKKLTIGILAHVDAGKTTLSEALLYISGKIRMLGRVDHKNTFLDTNAVERERGITIFSKQARFSSKNCYFILLDTPGHVDFSAEAERTLALLDYAILVVSASEGVQNHTKTLWTLLEHYGVPTFIFVNKCDIGIKLKEEIAEQISSLLSGECVSFYDTDSKQQLDERLAMLSEEFLDTHLSGEEIADDDIAALVATRKLFPITFGSALRMNGIEFLLELIDKYTLEPIYDSKDFAAKVYKISRAGNTRLSYMKITGGTLSARDEISYIAADGKRVTEKVSQIRLYSGEKFEQVDSASAGEICAVIGLSATYAGQGLGAEANGSAPILEPVLSYRIILPRGCDPNLYFPKLKELEEEEPSLHLYWNEELRQIEARLMGEIQIDLIKRLALDRFGIECSFDIGKILYKEKISSKAIGVGHFEPLRHYAEVQLLLEPQPAGTGLVFDIRLPENMLATNWQRLILSHLYEKSHRGVLTGAILTDTKITLIAGKAHLKHTEGGDFRQAALRAVRHGLMKGGCTLLEPFYKFQLEIPTAFVGKAMNDLQMRCAEFSLESNTEEFTVIKGRAPVATIHDYVSEVISYTRGEGKLTCVGDGYDECHNADEIIEKSGYDPEADLRNPPHSVFCANGAGYVVNWREVDSMKHVDVDVKVGETVSAVIPKAATLARKYSLSDDELEAIMLREFGPIRRKKYSEPKVISAPKAKQNKKPLQKQESMVIVDGYNLIYGWDELKEVADFSLEKARETVMDILSNYVSFTKQSLTLVFDAYLVNEGVGSDFVHDGYRVVYTKENQTADAFIERMMHELGPNYKIRVVTGDRLVQFAAVHSGISRMTVKEFVDELISVGNEINDFVRKLSENNE